MEYGMKMNLPNKLTILRTVMIPFFILFLYTDWFHGYDKIIAAVIFIAASLTDIRLVASDNGVVIAASYWGKFKTTFQMLMIIYLVVDLQFAYANVVGMVLVYVALALTVISLVDYIAKNYKVFLEGSSK